MTPKKYRTKIVERGKYTTYEKKAREFFRAMMASLENEDWDATCLNAAHCVISASDALVVKFAGMRSASESHEDAAGLVRIHVPDNQAGRKAETLTKIINYKHVAAYEAHEIRSPDAHSVAKITKRYFDWAMALLKLNK